MTLHPFDIKTVVLAKHAQHVVLIVLIWVVWFIHRRNRRDQEGVLPGYRLPIESVAIVIVAITGHLGGFLSGVNEPG